MNFEIDVHDGGFINVSTGSCHALVSVELTVHGIMFPVYIYLRLKSGDFWRSVPVIFRPSLFCTKYLHPVDTMSNVNASIFKINKCTFLVPF
jgi:hypothetical protein